MSNYRNPDNYGFSYTEKTRSIEELTKSVEELEENPPAGTTDYEQLQNKPKINDEVLSGNKTSDDLHIKGSQPKVEGENLIFS